MKHLSSVTSAENHTSSGINISMGGGGGGGGGTFSWMLSVLQHFKSLALQAFLGQQQAQADARIAQDEAR
jgi:hypothetical protein